MAVELDERVPLASSVCQVVAFRLGLDAVLAGMRAGIHVVGHIEVRTYIRRSRSCDKMAPGRCRRI